MKSPSFLILPLLSLFFSPSIFAAGPAGYIVYWGNAPYVAHPTSIGVLKDGSQIVSNATALAAGNGTAFAICSGSTVFGWGWNNHGQATGQPTAERAGGLVTMNGQALGNIVAISAEGIPVLALRDDGTVTAWGGEPTATNVNNVVSLCGRYHLGVRRDGTVIDLLKGTPIYGLSNVVMLAAPPIANGGIFGLNGTDTVFKFDLREGPTYTGLTNAISIASGEWQSLALRRDGTVVAMGGQRKVPVALDNIVAIGVGRSHSLVLRNDGTVVAWDDWEPSYFPAAKVPAGLSNIVAIAAGPDYSMAITTNRAVAERFMPKQ